MKRIITTLLLVLVPLAMLPLALIARARVVTMEHPRIHLIHDMDNQGRYKAQQENDAFADGRAMRLPVPGTVARGELEADDHYYRGVKDGVYALGWPEQVKVDMALLERGKQRFEIYCAVCHGYTGGATDADGKKMLGMINDRAEQLKAQGVKGMAWVPPTSYQEPQLLQADPKQNNYGSNGYLFHVITNGVRNMSSYASQIPVHDRWAIVAYIRALQFAQHPNLDGTKQ